MRESRGPLRSRGIFLVLILLAAALRFPSSPRARMHADEGVHADKFGTLLEGGGYAYDPSEYHGPTLYYLTLVPAWLQGASRYARHRRGHPALRSRRAGPGPVAAHLLARGSLGSAGAAIAALLAAISPAMVFYSRYYIHEIPLVFFTFGALLAAGRYRRAPGAAPALLAGACAGLMIATKETAPLALGSMLVALALTRLGRAAARRAGPRSGLDARGPVPAGTCCWPCSRPPSCRRRSSRPS